MTPQDHDPRDLRALLENHSKRCAQVVENADRYRLQILLGEITERDGELVLQRSRLGDPAALVRLLSSWTTCLSIGESGLRGGSTSRATGTRTIPVRKFIREPSAIAAA